MFANRELRCPNQPESKHEYHYFDNAPCGRDADLLTDSASVHMCYVGTDTTLLNLTTFTSCLHLQDLLFFTFKSTTYISTNII